MRRWATSVLFLAVWGIGCGSGKSTEVQTAPHFELKDLSGRTVTPEMFRGHPVLLDFWATWCGPCRMTIPLVQQFYLKHQAEGLVALGINVDDDPSVVFPFVKKFQMTYPVLYAGSSSVLQDYQTEGVLPTFILMDQKGRIVRRFQGFNMETYYAWESELNRLLKNPP